MKSTTMNDISNDPFCSDADPDLAFAREQGAHRKGTGGKGKPGGGQEPACACQAEPLEGNTTRRQTLIAAGLLLSLPLASAAAPLEQMVPCRQTRQKIRPCQHKFCRHYGGGEDYYGR